MPHTTRSPRSFITMAERHRERLGQTPQEFKKTVDRQLNEQKKYFDKIVKLYSRTSSPPEQVDHNQ